MEHRPSPGSTTPITYSSLHVNGQPGLEVYTSSGLEVDTSAHLKGHDAPIVIHGVNPYIDASQTYSHQPPPQVPIYRRRKWIVGGAIILLLVVVAAVVGGVLGSRHGTSKETASKGPNSTGDPASTNDALKGDSIRSNSKLAATGFYNGDDYGLQVFYQGPDNMLRYSLFQGNFAQWTPPIDINDNVDDGTPLAVCTFYFRADVSARAERQIQFYYVSGGEMSGLNWRGSESGPGTRDSVNDDTIPIDSSSEMACYWPSHVFQKEDGTLTEVLYNARWEIYDLNVRAASGSPLVMLPLKAEHYSSAPLNDRNDTDGRILYRAEDGSLHTYDWKNGTETGSGPLPAKISSNAGLGAFAARRSISSNEVNTWVLFQDDDGTIKYLEQTIGTDWKDPQTDPVFDGADNPTNIACITPGTTSSPAFLPLKASFETSFCYFQVGGKLKQVKFDGERWSDGGFVPIP